MEKSEFNQLIEVISDFRELVAEKFVEQEIKLNEVISRLDDHDTRFDKIDTRLSDHDTQFDKIDTRFDKIDKNMDWVKEVLDSHTGMLEPV